jgi:RimJ/RimL family protein N-acetyltransferase
LGINALMQLGPTLETERLILRPPVQSDFAPWAEFAGHEEVGKFLGGATLPDAAWRGMAIHVGSWVLLGYGMFSVIEKQTGVWIGRVGPWRPAGEDGGWPGNEIGWGITHAAWGRGYAREAAAATMAWVIDALGWTDIIHCIDPANANSQRVAIALGSRNRGAGKLPSPFQDAPVDIWGQTAAEWRAKRT